jgi:hypothetical protein
MEVIKDHYDQPVCRRDLIADDVVLDAKDDWTRRRCGARGAWARERDFLEGRNSLSLLAIEQREVSGRQPADGMPVLVKRDDVDLHEIDASAKLRLLRGGPSGAVPGDDRADDDSDQSAGAHASSLGSGPSE